MGSGHFLEEGIGKSSYFRNILIVDSSNNVKVPKGIGTFTEQFNCYDVQTSNNGDWGHYFYYRGPGWASTYDLSTVELKGKRERERRGHETRFCAYKD
ncbi:hypothetical protein L1049_025178 [Liquidambar formosana]|uniref:Neprosin PEP catalytic domain-containing protein n=1 Tax=Liquidambar formosana TaxID=63359 RepID=A0AAP0S1T5_LIQFO